MKGVSKAMEIIKEWIEGWQELYEIWPEGGGGGGWGDVKVQITGPLAYRPTPLTYIHEEFCIRCEQWCTNFVQGREGCRTAPPPSHAAK